MHRGERLRIISTTLTLGARALTARAEVSIYIPPRQGLGDVEVGPLDLECDTSQTCSFWDACQDDSCCKIENVIINC
jgi:hypothetical protein